MKKNYFIDYYIGEYMHKKPAEKKAALKLKISKQKKRKAEEAKDKAVIAKEKQLQRKESGNAKEKSNYS
jgi:hypothetical protein